MDSESKENNCRLSQPAKIYPTASVEDCTLADESVIYHGARVRSTTLLKAASIGDWTCCERSFLEDYAAIHRFNYIAGSRIGRHSYTGMNSVLIDVTVGRFSCIGWNVSMGGANHEYSRVTMHSFLYSKNSSLRGEFDPAYDRFKDKCTIGNDVWIGANAVVLRNVAIGDGAVIGAGSVVTKDIPAYSIAVGSPAKVVKSRFPETLANLLAESQWWNLPDEIIREHFQLFSSNASVHVAKRLIEIAFKYRRSINSDAK